MLVQGELGFGSAIKIKIPWLFILHCARLALLCFAKLGFGSAIKIKIPWLFILHCARLTLTLLREVRLRLGNAKEKTRFFLCTALALH